MGTILDIDYYMDDDGGLLCKKCAEVVGDCEVDTFRVVLDDGEDGFTLLCDRCRKNIEGTEVA